MGFVTFKVLININQIIIVGLLVVCFISERILCQSGNRLIYSGVVICEVYVNGHFVNKYRTADKKEIKNDCILGRSRFWLFSYVYI